MPQNKPVLYPPSAAARRVDLDERTWAKRACYHAVKPVAFMCAGGTRALVPLYDDAAIEDMKFQLAGDTGSFVTRPEELKHITPAVIAEYLASFTR